MIRFASLLVLLAVRLPAQGGLEIIDTPQGRCVVWGSPTGGSSSKDLSYRRCALDRIPVLRDGSEMLPSPRVSLHAGGGFRIIVNADGSVDTSLTRATTMTGDEESHAQILATIKRWQFEPGERAGIRVRSVFDLDVRTDRRPSDTLPARLDWRYASGVERDSLVGRWVTEAPLEPLAEDAVDSVHVAMLRQLVRMRVISPRKDRDYCLAIESDGDAKPRLQRVARAVQSVIPGVGVNACVDTPNRVRLLLPRVHRTENGRAVMSVRGAQLPRWPTGFDARAWPRWAGRCIGVVQSREPVTVTCDIGPDAPWAERSPWYDPRPQPISTARAPRSADEPLQLTLIATMSGAYGLDTLRAIARGVPHLREIAVHDSVRTPGGWLIVSPTDSNALVVFGNPTERDLRIIRAQVTPQGMAVPSSQTAVAPAKGPDPFAAFLLGGVGQRPLGPVMLCFGLSCRRRYDLDPERHTLTEPQLRLSVASLREDSRTPLGLLQLRLIVDPVPEGLTPLVVMAGPHGKVSRALLVRGVGGGVWQWNMDASGLDWTTAEVLVYLVRR